MSFFETQCICQSHTDTVSIYPKTVKNNLKYIVAHIHFNILIPLTIQRKNIMVIPNGWTLILNNLHSEKKICNFDQYLAIHWKWMERDMTDCSSDLKWSQVNAHLWFCTKYHHLDLWWQLEVNSVLETNYHSYRWNVSPLQGVKTQNCPIGN